MKETPASPKNLQAPDPGIRINPERRQFIRNLLCGSAAMGLLGLTGRSLYNRVGFPSFPEVARKGTQQSANNAGDIVNRHFSILSRDLDLTMRKTNRELNKAFSLLEQGLRRDGNRFAGEKITRVNITRLRRFGA